MLKVKNSKKLLVAAKQKYIDQLKSHKLLMQELDIIISNENPKTSKTDVGIMGSKRSYSSTKDISQGTQQRRLQKTMKGAHKNHNIMTQCQTILKKLMNHKCGYQVSAIEILNQLSNYQYDMYILFFKVISSNQFKKL